MSTTYGLATADLIGGRPDNAASHETRTRVMRASHGKRSWLAGVAALLFYIALVDNPVDI
jgi:hypothetical protein